MPDLDDLLKPQPRVRVLRPGRPDPEGLCVVYWMQRAQRALDNPALNHAIELGNALKLPVLAVFGLTADYPGAVRRHYRFLVDALPETREAMAKRGVPLILRIGSPADVAAAVATEAKAAILVGDENPVRVGMAWRAAVAAKVAMPFVVVDADVVVPSALFPKEEFAARTIRPKIAKVRETYLVAPGNPKAKVPWGDRAIPEGEAIDPDGLLAKLNVGGVAEVAGYPGGTAEAVRRLTRFVKDRLPRYATERNEPVPYMTSELSAHLHFGHIGPLTIALAVQGSDAPKESVDAYLEELIVRRELSINFIARNPSYDKLAGCPAWALKTLAKHAGDPRPILYSAAQMEAAETGDPLWNAAQKEMLLTGRMHNYLRMYWGKKILQWAADAEAAFEICRNMNDTYFLCGRNPNGWTGVAWAIGGKHDRPWGERAIFGMVRYMSYESTRKKFDSAGYIAYVKGLERGAW